MATLFVSTGGVRVGSAFVIRIHGFPRFLCNRTGKKSAKCASLEFQVLIDTTLVIFHVEARCKSLSLSQGSSRMDRAFVWDVSWLRETLERMA